MRKLPGNQWACLDFLLASGLEVLLIALGRLGFSLLGWADDDDSSKQRYASMGKHQKTGSVTSFLGDANRAMKIYDISAQW